MIATCQISANGMAFYFKVYLDQHQDLFSQSSAPTPRISLPGTPVSSSLPSPQIEFFDKYAPKSGSPTASMHKRHPYLHFTLSSHSSDHRLPVTRNHHHHFHLSFHRSHENPVGVFEFQKYLNLESRFHHPAADSLKERAMNLLGECSSCLLLCSSEALRHVVLWLDRMNSERFREFYCQSREKRWDEVVAENRLMTIRLTNALAEFREKER